MNITTFIQRMQGYTPTGWEFWAGIARTDYNREKQLSDTMLLVIPRRWPQEWRPDCSHDLEFELWFGKLWRLRRPVKQLEQHDPSEPVEAMQAMHTTAAKVLAAITEDPAMQVLESDYMEFFPSGDGKSINQQFWLRVPVKLRCWNYETGFDYITDFKILS
jgi:hypothetical protein